MAGIGYDAATNRWRVQWYDSNKSRRKRLFASEAEARAFVAREALPVPKRGAKRRTRSDVIDHLAANFEVSDDSCWLWTGKLTNAGYGRLTWKHVDATVPGAHRVVLHAIGQPIPDGLVVDHLCRNRHCINPDHLDMVIQRENVMRSPVAPGALNAAKTHCPQGHEYSPENTYVYTFKTRKTTTRICRTCSRDYHREYNQRKRTERQAVSA